MIKTGLKISLVLLTVMAAITAYGWSVIPNTAEIPIHFDGSGAADGWASKLKGLLIVPVMGVGLTFLFMLLPAIAPFRQNLEQSKTPYLWVWGLSLALLIYIQSLTVYAAMYDMAALPGWSMKGLAAALSVLFLVIGNYLGKTRRNFFLGIRTPWTLSSDLSWEKTHRLVGRIWLVAGMISLASVFFIDADKTLNGLMIAIIASAILGVIYSYRVWRSDPNKHEKYDITTE